MSEFVPLSTNEIVTPTIIQKIANTWIPGSKVISYSVAKENEIKGFLSLMYEVEIEVKMDEVKAEGDDSTSSTLSVMFKTIPRNPIRLEMILDGKFYLKETQMYEKILPELLSESPAGFSLFPKPILTFYNGHEDYIVMENLKPMGYKLVEKGKALDLKHAKLVVEALAKFHSLSYIKWKGCGQEILKSYPFLQDNLWKDEDLLNTYFKGYVENTFADLMALLEKNNKIKEKKRLEDFLNQTNLYVKMHQLCSLPDNQFPAVICHGDPWFNNILFKYNSKGNPVEIKFVDYQLSKVGSRMLDLSYLFFTSLEIDVLNNNTRLLLEIYHKSFAKQVSKLIDQEFKQSIESFENEWKKYKYYGLIMGLYLLPPMNASPENIPDFESMTQEDIENRNCKEVGTESKFANFLNQERVLPKLVNLIQNHLD